MLQEEHSRATTAEQTPLVLMVGIQGCASTSTPLVLGPNHSLIWRKDTVLQQGLLPHRTMS